MFFQFFIDIVISRTQGLPYFITFFGGDGDCMFGERRVQFALGKRVGMVRIDVQNLLHCGLRVLFNFNLVYYGNQETNINQYTFGNLVLDMKSRVKTESDGRKNVVEPCMEPCSIERGMRVLGGKWKGSILWHLKDEPVRFNDLTRMVGGASKKMIDQRLKEMEKEGLVRREVLSDRPIAVAYQATDFGRSALGILEQLKNWAEENNL